MFTLLAVGRAVGVGWILASKKDVAEMDEKGSPESKPVPAAHNETDK